MRLYPSPFQIGDRFTFENRHGRCVLEAVTLPEPVSGIYLIDAPEECLMTWDEVGQIALISDQVRLQPITGRTLDAKCAFIRHVTTSEAGFVKIVSLEYLTPVAAHKQIAAEMDAGRNRMLA